ncbi:regulator [Methylolobus aquaticus]|nr:regulator [Methylolobus aquaticus]
MPTFHFDDSNIRWNTLEGFEHLSYSILDIDERNGIIDVLFKFAANRQIVLHRHKALNHLLVIQGEHRLYHADGRLKEIRPVGRYTVSPPSDEPHREGGGVEQDAVVFFSIRGDGLLYEILGDDLQPIGTLGKEDFVALYAAQQSAAK